MMTVVVVEEVVSCNDQVWVLKRPLQHQNGVSLRGRKVERMQRHRQKTFTVEEREWECSPP